LPIKENNQKHWLEFAGEQIISQIELVALVAIRWFFRWKLENRRLISWVDNEASRISAIKASSPSRSMRALTRVLADMEVLWVVYSWVERVCSFSNPGDLLSRNRLAEAKHRFQVTDGGVIDVSDDLTHVVLTVFKQPFGTALLKRGDTT